MEYPWACQRCGFLNMVDMKNGIQLRSIDKILGRIGYVCDGCGEFQTIHLTTNSLEKSLENLMSMKPTHSKLAFHFKKALHKALEVQVKYGAR